MIVFVTRDRHLKDNGEGIKDEQYCSPFKKFKPFNPPDLVRGPFKPFALLVRDFKGGAIGLSNKKIEYHRYEFFLY